MPEQLFKLQILIHEQLPVPTDSPSGLLENLPQYAALITATIVILLFVIKEVIEGARRRKAKENDENAIDKLAAVQGLNTLWRLLFVLKLANQINPHSKIKLEADVNKGIRNVAVDKNQVIAIPPPLSNFSNEVILAAAKISSAKFAFFANFTDVKGQLDMIIDSLLYHLKGGSIENVVDALSEKPEVKNMGHTILGLLEKIEPSLMKNNAYDDLVSNINDELKKLI